MFDAPYFAPCLVGPLIGLVFAALVVTFGMLVERRVFKGTTKYRLSRVLALYVGVMACCEYINLNFSDPDRPLYITDADIVGKWYLPPGGYYLKGYSREDNEVVFHDDGTFHMDKVPNAWGYLGISPGAGYITGSGTWRLVHLEARRVTAQFEMVNGEASNEALNFEVVGSGPPYRLRYSLSELEGVEFYKK